MLYLIVQLKPENLGPHWACRCFGKTLPIIQVTQVKNTTYGGVALQRLNRRSTGTTMEKIKDKKSESSKRIWIPIQNHFLIDVQWGSKRADERMVNRTRSVVAYTRSARENWPARIVLLTNKPDSSVPSSSGREHSCTDHTLIFYAHCCCWWWPFKSKCGLFCLLSYFMRRFCFVLFCRIELNDVEEASWWRFPGMPDLDNRILKLLTIPLFYEITR